jgi:hypothetical protein
VTNSESDSEQSELADTHEAVRDVLSIEERLGKPEKLTDDERERLHDEVLAELSDADVAPNTDTTCSLCGMEATVMTAEGSFCAEHAALAGGKN